MFMRTNEYRIKSVSKDTFSWCSYVPHLHVCSQLAHRCGTCEQCFELKLLKKARNTIKVILKKTTMCQKKSLLTMLSKCVHRNYTNYEKKLFLM